MTYLFLLFTDDRVQLFRLGQSITLFFAIMALFPLLFFSRLVIEGLTENFFSGPFSEQVELLVIPWLSENKGFPFDSWLRLVAASSKIAPNPWLFYSALRLGSRHTGWAALRIFCSFAIPLRGQVLHPFNLTVNSL